MAELLIVELDASVIINLLQNLNRENLLLMPIIVESWELVRRFREFWIQHAYRECNRAADFLARMPEDLPLGAIDAVMLMSPWKNSSLFC